MVVVSLPEWTHPLADVIKCCANLLPHPAEEREDQSKGAVTVTDEGGQVDDNPFRIPSNPTTTTAEEIKVDEDKNAFDGDQQNTTTARQGDDRGEQIIIIDGIIVDCELAARSQSGDVAMQTTKDDDKISETFETDTKGENQPDQS